MRKCLKTIGSLVEEYTPRIENIFGKEIGDVKVREYSFHEFQDDCIKVYNEFRGSEMGRLKELVQRLLIKVEFQNKPYMMITFMDQIYVNLKNLNKAKSVLPLEEAVKKITAHELGHALDFANNLSNNIRKKKIQQYVSEGFAEFVSFEFPEIYQDEKVKDYLKVAHEKEKDYLKKVYNLKRSEIEKRKDPYVTGHEFFKKVAEKIGKENVLKVFDNPPQIMEEILEPEKYLQRIGGDSGETK